MNGVASHRTCYEVHRMKYHMLRTKPYFTKCCDMLRTRSHQHQKIRSFMSEYCCPSLKGKSMPLADLRRQVAPPIFTDPGHQRLGIVKRKRWFKKYSRTLATIRTLKNLETLAKVTISFEKQGPAAMKMWTRENRRVGQDSYSRHRFFVDFIKNTPFNF